jgi:predicted dehydrogenase
MRMFSRRQFLQGTTAAALLAGTGRILAAEKKPKETSDTSKNGSANDRLKVAVVGVNGRGMSHVGGFANRHNCIITTICDPDVGVITPAMTTVYKAQGFFPRWEADLRKVLEDPTIDIVSIATPNHWHALAAIWAIQHGKDVYVEKPVSHNVSEGRRIVEAARKHDKICQAGTQSRSSAGMREAIDFLHAGKLGKVRLARGLCYKLRPSIGKVDKEQDIPKTIDYDLWCGPAPKKPLMRKKLHYDWHWVWDYGNGDLGNQGIHEMDKARWGLGKNELPASVISLGGRFGYVDDGQTANTQICVFDYGDCELIFEVRGLPSKTPFPHEKESAVPTNHVGNIWYGEQGIMVAPSYTGAVAYSPNGDIVAKFSGGEDHFGNFVEAVRSRKPSLLHADILEGHLSSALCHLGNISYRLGTPTPFSKGSQPFGGDKDAAEALANMQEHLKERMVPLEETECRVGPKLAFDTKTETFPGNKEANALLTREYRKGFEVPEKV